MYSTNNFRKIWCKQHYNLIKKIAVPRIRTSRTRIIKYFKIPHIHANNTFLLLLPNNFKIVIFIKTNIYYIYIYNKLYSLLLCFNLLCIKFWNIYTMLNCLFIQFIGKYYIYNICIQYIYNFIKLLHTQYVQRIKLLGRLYRIYPDHMDQSGPWRVLDDLVDVITYRSGQTHLTWVVIENVMIHYYRKRRFFVYGPQKNELMQIANEVANWFPLNIYTQRGVFISKQIRYKRMGKAVRF